MKNPIWTGLYVLEFGAIAVMIAVVVMIALQGCTEQQRARSMGGTATIELPANTKLVNITWKDKESLWLLTRPMRQGETAETLEFKESSNFGILEGRVVITEVRK